MLRIVAIDDDPCDQAIVARSLRSYDDLSLKTYAHPQEALDSEEMPPDLVLLDFAVPGLTEFEPFEMIHLNWPQVPVVVLTGNEDLKVYRQAIQAGAHDCLCKNELLPTQLMRCIYNTLERHTLQQELRTRACSDALTGLPNRAAIVLELEQRFAQGSNREPFCLLFLDIDDFKLINDGYGHDVGDQYLLEFVKRAQACLGARDILARFAGDEFVVLLHGCADDTGVSDFVGCLEDSLNIPILIDGNELYTAVSIGVVADRSDYKDYKEMLLEADTAMFAAKSRGKARYVWFDAQMRAEALERLSFEHSLRHAVECHELQLMYQPLVDISTGHVEGFEALMRWTRPDGVVPPLKFIPIAERTGVIHRFGRWAIDTACRQASQWRKLAPELTISVNVSPVQLEHPAFPDAVFESLGRHDLPPEALTIEITESGAIKEFDSAVGILTQLRQAGLSISVDDFGTGHSSLSQLHKLPVSEVKIDKSFVHAMADQTDYSRLFVETIHVLAGSLGLTTVAEGIETQEQRQLLLDCGYERGQGYLFAPPLAVTAATEHLKRSMDSQAAVTCLVPDISRTSNSAIQPVELSVHD